MAAGKSNVLAVPLALVLALFTPFAYETEQLRTVSLL